MPRGYDEYLYESLCQPESGDEAPVNVYDSTPSRRPSISEALPRIPIRIEGGGVTINLKAGPHVRWTKLLSKWSACFVESGGSPMAWPVNVRLGGSDKTFSLTSIQESISKSVGPEDLFRVSDHDPALFVSIGQVSKAELDVEPPLAQSETRNTLEEESVLESEKTEVQKSDQIRVLVTSSLVSRKLKLNVSGKCLVSRLIRKWLEALKSDMDPRSIELFYNGSLLDPEKALWDAIGAQQEGDGVRYEITAVPKMEESPKRKKTKHRNEETPPTAAPTNTNECEKEQQLELEYWKQLKFAEAEGLGSFLDNEIDSNYIDDEEALAMALSLSEALNS